MPYAPDPTNVSPIYVNGRFLKRPTTGVERFAAGVLHAIDDRMDGSTQAARWTILTPPSDTPDYGFRNIKVSQCGTRHGHLWEQIDLMRTSRKGLLINLCNSAPVLHPRQLTVIHDALVFRFPEGFSRAYGLVHRNLGRILSRRSHIATVSEFSRRELASVFGLPEKSIAVIPNALDHLDAITPDDTVLDTFGLRDRPFLLFVGSPAPNKNLMRAIEAFGRIDDREARFVVVGSAAKSFSEGLAGDMPAHLIRTGRLSDEQVKALYTRAKALVFPSTYEGFGIPPLEAMSVGCPVIAADIPVLREVCADAAGYFDPYDISSIAGAMNGVLNGQTDLEALKRAGERRIASFSWKKSADELLRLVGDIDTRAR